MEYVQNSYCGLYCGACTLLLNTKAGIGDAQCFGCKSAQPGGYCRTCTIKACAKAKGIEFCVECTDLKTCQMMDIFINDEKCPYHAVVPKNFAAIKAAGRTKWLAEQAQRWSCPACGRQQDWLEETCKKCGAAVTNYRADC